MNFMEALKRSSVAASNGREMTKKNRSQEILMSQGCKVYSDGMMRSLGC